ncbi:MAG: amidase [Rhizomicrobium sp.]
MSQKPDPTADDAGTATSIAAAVRSGLVSARAVTDAALDRIRRVNPRLNAFVVVDEEGARRAAEAVDAAVRAGRDPGALAGVPFGVKDGESLKGSPTSYGSLFYKGAPPATVDSPHVARLRAAGAVPLGKVAASEFGCDGVTDTRAWGTTRNPWNLARTPSGSSGGSAAAVSGGLVPFCTASDGGGSIRCPAAFCGLVGLKPSHGRVPRESGASTEACYGALTTTVAETARYLDIAAGPDDRDRMSLPAFGGKYEELIETLSVAGLRAAWSPDLGFHPIDPEVKDIAQGAAHDLVSRAGLEMTDVRPVLTNVYVDWLVLAADGLLARLEAGGFWPSRRDDISTRPREFLDRYGHATPQTLQALRERSAQLEREVAALFAQVDVLLCPTAATVAYDACGPLPDTIAGRYAGHTNAEGFTPFANICWNPSISVPAGLNSEGLPVGLLITVRRHRDDIALRLARILEQNRPWPRLAPGY